MQTAHAEFALLLPEKPFIEKMHSTPLNMTLDMLDGIIPPNITRDPTIIKLIFSVLDPFTGKAIPAQMPQSLSALCIKGEQHERSEHLSMLKKISAYGQTAYQANIGLYNHGVYHFLLKTKAMWLQKEDHFIQYITKVQVPIFPASDGWDQSTETSFEIVPLTRPFGLCSGMSFTGKILRDGLPIADSLVNIAWLNNAVKAKMTSDVANKKRRFPIPESPYHSIHQIKADSHGIFTFTCPQPGWWAFSVSGSGDPLQDPHGKVKPLEIKTIFWVYFSTCNDGF